MFFRKKKRIRELEGEIDLINKRLDKIDEAELKRIITDEDVERRLKRLEKVFAGLIKDKNELCERVTELEAKVKELSTKKISETTTEDEETVSVSQILDEYLNGDEEE